jgi:Mg-chelatase subunit ChlD
MRIVVPGQSNQKKVLEASFQLREKKMAAVVSTCHPSKARKHKIEELCSRPAWEKVKLYLQNNHNKKGCRHVP